MTFDDEDGFEDVASLHQVREGGVLPVTVGRQEVLLHRRGSRVFAVSGRCTHAFASLAEAGRVEEGVIVCTRHGARFDLATGRSLRGDCANLPTFPVRIEGARVLVGREEDS